MASLIWLGNLYPSQERVKAHSSHNIIFLDSPELSSTWNLDEDIRGNYTRAFIAKGNSIEGVEAKT